jgi:SAM-dependent methyltransferase
MFAYTKSTLDDAELAAKDGSIVDPLRALRKLPLSDFGELMWMLPAEDYPNLSALLPKMADVDVQNGWTGANGYTLLVQTVDFIRMLAHAYLKLAGSDLRGATVLDYGCGYGRMIRLMYYFTDPNSLWGLDPWDEAIRICRSDRLAGNLRVSDYLPGNLPVQDCVFDVVYAFSVFTHTSERATRTALQSLWKNIATSGLLALTIRPREYWASEPQYQDQAAKFESLHDSMGFSFSPHPRAAVDGDVTFGDTSMTLEWLQANAPEWKIVDFDRNLSDPTQVIVFLRPR